MKVYKIIANINRTGAEAFVRIRNIADGNGVSLENVTAQIERFVIQGLSPREVREHIKDVVDYVVLRLGKKRTRELLRAILEEVGE